MRTNAVKALMTSGGTALVGWCGIGNGYAAELMGHAGFDGVVIDMQHGQVYLDQAIPMLQDSTDKELVAGLMDGLPLYTAFKAGETDLRAGLDLAFELSKGWARGSTTLVVLTDGDLSQDVIPPARPASIVDGSSPLAYLYPSRPRMRWSPPLQNAQPPSLGDGPLPVSNTQPTSDVCRAWSRAVKSSSTVCGRNALRTSGRLKAMRTVPDSTLRW
jgi:hypothetical protein